MHKSKIIELGGQNFDVRFRVNSRAKNIILHVDSVSGDIILTLPNGVQEKSGLDFINKRSEWLTQQVKKLCPTIRLEPGATIPFMGSECTIFHKPRQRTPVVHSKGLLIVGGRIEHTSRRVIDWLRQRARLEIEARVIEKTRLRKLKYTKINIRDTRTRWGSCSNSGALSFSWRLILAPDWVLDYVVAHEVAHLEHLNHSSDFWEVVENLCHKVKEAREWLSENGTMLHSFQRSRV